MGIPWVMLRLMMRYGDSLDGIGRRDRLSPFQETGISVTGGQATPVACGNCAAIQQLQIFVWVVAIGAKDAVRILFF